MLELRRGEKNGRIAQFYLVFFFEFYKRQDRSLSIVRLLINFRSCSDRVFLGYNLAWYDLFCLQQLLTNRTPFRNTKVSIGEAPLYIFDQWPSLTTWACTVNAVFTKTKLYPAHVLLVKKVFVNLVASLKFIHNDILLSLRNAYCMAYLQSILYPL